MTQEGFYSAKHGVLCLTFDDGRHAQWLEHLALFRRYGAHATFFYMNDLDAPALDSIKILQAEGHSIGLHTLNHCDTVPNLTPATCHEYWDREIAPHQDALRQAGLPLAEYFAYPNNRRDEYAESVMARHFRHCRGGTIPPIPKGSWLAEQPQLFIPLPKVAETLTLGGYGVGDYYSSTNDNLDAALAHAAKSNLLIVLFSHGISIDATGVNVRTDMLEHILSTATTLNMAILGFDELPSHYPR